MNFLNLQKFGVVLKIKAAFVPRKGHLPEPGTINPRMVTDSNNVFPNNVSDVDIQ